jgi:hypothetical protein
VQSDRAQAIGIGEFEHWRVKDGTANAVALSSPLVSNDWFGQIDQVIDDAEARRAGSDDPEFKRQLDLEERIRRVQDAAETFKHAEQRLRARGVHADAPGATWSMGGFGADLVIWRPHSATEEIGHLALRVSATSSSIGAILSVPGAEPVMETITTADLTLQKVEDLALRLIKAVVI